MRTIKRFEASNESTLKAASIYVRDSRCFIGTSDRTTDGVWIGRGNTTVVHLDQNEALGAAVLDALRLSRTKIPHPAQSEWTAVRRRSLDPIVAAAGLRSWRSFIRSAQLISVHLEADTLELELYERDDRRSGFFKSFENRRTASPICQPSSIGLAVHEILRGHELLATDTQ